MIKIWAKTYINKKIILSEIIYIDEKYNSNCFDNYVRLVCHELDIPTPVIVSSNEINFSKFNITRWKTSDFIEQVDFDEFSIEYCTIG